MREEDIEPPTLDSEADDRLFLCLRIVKGWSLGARLTGRGVTAHVEGALSGWPQSRENGRLVQLGGSSKMSFLISAMMSSSGPWLM
jgi:hypothetical protein